MVKPGSIIGGLIIAVSVAIQVITIVEITKYYWLLFIWDPFCCIRLLHSTYVEVGVIATPGSLSPALETPWEMWGVGSATLGQRRCCPRVPVLGESLLLLHPPYKTDVNKTNKNSTYMD